jgi:HK97 family phage major capsid protein
MTNVLIRREPLTYEALSPHSFFLDTARAQALGDDTAQERLFRHLLEMDVETRADNTTSGTGGEFALPLYLIDHYKIAARAGRPFGDLLNPIPLPRGVQSITVPRTITNNILGSETGVQAGQGGPITEGDPTTGSTTAPVVTIAGSIVVSQQLLDQTPSPGFDVVAYADMVADYNAVLEGQLLNGTGTNGQVLGLSNFSIPAANTVSGASVGATSPTMLTALWPLMGQAFAAIGNNRGLAPEFWLMAPRRWASIAASLDSSSRPIVSPGGGTAHMDHPEMAAGGQSPFGPIHGLPVYCDGAIPAGTTADTIYCIRPHDMYLFESTALTQTSVNATAGTLQVRLSLHKYVAFVGNLFTSGVAKVTAIPQPTNY